MSHYNLNDVLPHEAPMILISRLISHGLNGCVCEVDINQDSAFFDTDKNGVPSYIGTEYMAQTIAAYAGATALDAGDSVKIGFLLGSRKYEIKIPIFNCGDTVKISVEKLIDDESGLSVFDCSITNVQGELFAAAKINVFQPEDPISFLRKKS